MNLIKNTEGGRSKMELKYNSIFLKGENQGKEVEKERRTIEIISNGFKNNLSLEIIASIAGISVEEVKQYIKDNHLNNNIVGILPSLTDKEIENIKNERISKQ